jgi:hypothetical protein
MPNHRTFLVEAYAPATSELATLSRQAQAAAESAAATAGTGSPLRHIRSFLVPEDEICFHLFEAGSADTVARAIGIAEMRAQRIVEIRS